jgi:uncharacterized iron-regulated membrane protein
MTQALPQKRRPWPDFQAVWRWHFYAGLFCIPFVLWLAVTGSIYLFKPQIEAALDRPYAHLAAPGARIAPYGEIRSALAASPGSVLHAYQLPRQPGDAAQILVGKGTGETRVWIDPRNGKVLKMTPEDSRLMTTIFHLHGELLLGDRGSMAVELAASWAVVMIITGLYLWWPRQTQGLGGVLYPRLGRGSRIFWRDIHAVAGVWVSATTILLLASGLPWAKSWGGYFREIRQIAASAPVQQDWTTGRSSELAKRAALSAGSLAGQGGAMAGMDMGQSGAPHHSEHGGQHGGGHKSGGWRKRGGVALPLDAYSGIDRMVPSVAAQHLAYPVLITPPMKVGGVWGAQSDAQDRPLRVNLTLDPKTGAVLTREGFGQKPLVDRIVGVGIAAHEGQLFGWPNQLISLITATGLFTAACSALVLWWRRRPDGVLGAPIPAGPPRFATGLLAIVLILGVLLPLLGLTLVLVFLVERLVLRHIPGVARWLGLRASAPSTAIP